LVSKWYVKVRKVHFLDKVSDVVPLSVQSEDATDVAEDIWAIIVLLDAVAITISQTCMKI